MESAADFVLDPRLEADTLPVCDLPLCRVLLMNDARYPWCVLVPRVAGAREIHRLADDAQQRLWSETRRVAALLESLTEADKMNIAALGNMVPQLHMHVIARRQGDDAWPAPVWGKHPPLPYPSEAARELCGELRRALLPD